MWQQIAGVIGLSVAAVFLANSLAEHFAGQDNTVPAAPVSVQPVARAPVPENRRQETFIGRKTRIKADRRGHFVTQARMNGRRIDVLVDTGATSVAINRSMARSMGIRLSASDFKYSANTANGTVKMAIAKIDRVEIGRVSVPDVQAAVLPDTSLNQVLLGMSFLNELKSFEVRNGELILTQ